jgi:hypothetical protein
MYLGHSVDGALVYVWPLLTRILLSSKTGECILKYVNKGITRVFLQSL